MGRNRDFRYTINEKLPYCVPKCLNLVSTTKIMIPGAVFTKKWIRIAKKQVTYTSKWTKTVFSSIQSLLGRFFFLLF